MGEILAEHAPTLLIQMDSLERALDQRGLRARVANRSAREA
jgi:hypothetical protein